jgi:hypothetical protein
MALLLAHGIERTPVALGGFFGGSLNFVIFHSFMRFLAEMIRTMSPSVV